MCHLRYICSCRRVANKTVTKTRSTSFESPQNKARAIYSHPRGRYSRPNGLGRLVGKAGLDTSCGYTAILLSNPYPPPPARFGSFSGYTDLRKIQITACCEGKIPSLVLHSDFFKNIVKQQRRQQQQQRRQRYTIRHTKRICGILKTLHSCKRKSKS